MSERARRRAAYRKGHAAETAAALLLMAKGYRILARRVRLPVGEIDLVARRGRHIAFIEVKARRDGDAAAHAVSERQRRRMWRAAEAWLAHAGLHGAVPRDHGISLDVVLVQPWRLPRHLRQAFGHRL